MYNLYAYHYNVSCIYYIVYTIYCTKTLIDTTKNTYYITIRIDYKKQILFSNLKFTSIEEYI